MMRIVDIPRYTFPYNVLHILWRQCVHQRIAHQLDRICGCDEVVVLFALVHLILIFITSMRDILPTARFARGWGDV